jgi:hypothetical protein
MWGADYTRRNTLCHDKNECTARYTHNESLGYATRQLRNLLNSKRSHTCDVPSVLNQGNNSEAEIRGP